MSLTANQLLAAYPFLFLGFLCVGSFLNVVIYRLPRKKSVVYPGSSCPNCKHPIAWWQNLPLLSFVFLKGKCGHCSKKISWRYPLVEILTAVILFTAVWNNPFWPSWPGLFYFLASLVACSFIDLRHWIIPDKITLPGILIGLICSKWTIGIISSLVGVLFGGGILYAVAWIYHAYSGKDGIGDGDIKYLAMIGAFLGYQGALMTLVLSSIIGSLLGIGLILWKKRKGTTAIPFGPFLSLGAYVAFLFGDFLWSWYFGFRQ